MVVVVVACRNLNLRAGRNTDIEITKEKDEVERWKVSS